MHYCPCCSDRLLRHIRTTPQSGHSGIYWFCRQCWQEMPVFDAVDEKVLTVQELLQTSRSAVQTSALQAQANSLQPSERTTTGENLKIDDRAQRHHSEKLFSQHDRLLRCQ
jgi:hypothetical protein